MFTLSHCLRHMLSNMHTTLSKPVVTLALWLCFATALFAAPPPLPQCFPDESGWDNIHFASLDVANQHMPSIQHEGHFVSLTFTQYESFSPFYYAFAIQQDIDKVSPPALLQHAFLSEQFANQKLISLKGTTQRNQENTSYRFNPPEQGTWVIYLLASINKIGFLEQQALRIFPNVEKLRGGTVFSGSSLNLSNSIDYKACVVEMTP